MTGDDARDFVERLAAWEGSTSGEAMEEIIQDARDLVNPPRIPRRVYLSRDNIVSTYHSDGLQISELSGAFDQVSGKILELADEHTEYHGWKP